MLLGPFVIAFAITSEAYFQDNCKEGSSLCSCTRDDYGDYYRGIDRDDVDSSTDDNDGIDIDSNGNETDCDDIDITTEGLDLSTAVHHP